MDEWKLYVSKNLKIPYIVHSSCDNLESGDGSAWGAHDSCLDCGKQAPEHIRVQKKLLKPDFKKYWK